MNAELEVIGTLLNQGPSTVIALLALLVAYEALKALRDRSKRK
jgi:hypothetical protein